MWCSMKTELHLADFASVLHCSEFRLYCYLNRKRLEATGAVVEEITEHLQWDPLRTCNIQ